MRLNLHRVSAPLFVDGKTGLNDDLNGVERPVTFDIPDVGTDGQVVHSLAKWKRLALKRYEFHRRHRPLHRYERHPPGRGGGQPPLHLRGPVGLGEAHRPPGTGTPLYLKETVRDIVGAVCDTAAALRNAFPVLTFKPDRDVYFITTQELEDRFPDLTPSERETEICRKHRTVFLMQIGKTLKSGQRHDGRAPDYDDWELNGDILMWNPVLERSFELSSMGIRVDAAALDRQLTPGRLRQPPGAALPPDAAERRAAGVHRRRHRPVPAVHAADRHLPHRRGPGQPLGPRDPAHLRGGRRHAAVKEIHDTKTPRLPDCGRRGFCGFQTVELDRRRHAETPVWSSAVK